MITSAASLANPSSSSNIWGTHLKGPGEIVAAFHATRKNRLQRADTDCVVATASQMGARVADRNRIASPSVIASQRWYA